jgi:hypothetical protein
MEQTENNMHATVHVHEPTDWLSSYDSWLYNIDYSLWLHQKDIAVLRGNIHGMRSALPANARACLREDDDQRYHAGVGEAIDQENSQFNSFLSELTEASASNHDEITAYATERQCSVARDKNAPGTDVRASGVEDATANPQQLEDTVHMGLVERRGLAKRSLVKQRVGLRRSPRRRRQT